MSGHVVTSDERDALMIAAHGGRLGRAVEDLLAERIAAERERIARDIERMSSPHAGDPFKVRDDAARLARGV